MHLVFIEKNGSEQKNRTHKTVHERFLSYKFLSVAHCISTLTMYYIVFVTAAAVAAFFAFVMILSQKSCLAFYFISDNNKTRRRNSCMRSVNPLLLILCGIQSSVYVCDLESSNALRALQSFSCLACVHCILFFAVNCINAQSIV